jgi:hypothetical protein
MKKLVLVLGLLASSFAFASEDQVLGNVVAVKRTFELSVSRCLGSLRREQAYAICTVVVRQPRPGTMTYESVPHASEYSVSAQVVRDGKTLNLGLIPLSDGSGYEVQFASSYGFPMDDGTLAVELSTFLRSVRNRLEVVVHTVQ